MLLRIRGSALGSDQDAQGFVHLGMENLQGRRLKELSGQPVPLPTALLGKKVSPYI